MVHVLVVGGGGREHALVWKLAQSPKVTRISVAPGNAGTASIARNVDIDATDVVSLIDFAERERVDLVVIGPEEPLALGLVDQFQAVGIRVFGPRRDAALIESSKSYAKELMIRYGVPTAPYEVVTDLDSAMDYLYSHRFDEMVIKADGLARGKGVFLPAGESDAEGILRSLLEREALGMAGRRVVLEKRLVGEELSVMAFTDGQTLALMPPVHDYKRLYDHDLGPNTGGMGSYAPARLFAPDQVETVCRDIIEPVLAGLQAGGQPFAGVIYVGLVITANGPYALELNARLGDPSAQVVLPLLATDLLEVMDACVDGHLDEVEVRWHSGTAVTTVLATAGYPERADPGLPIRLAPVLPESVLLFHAGTRRAADGRLVTTGGRVLDVTATGPDLPAAVARVYDGVQRIHFDGAHYRTDIGQRAATGV